MGFDRPSVRYDGFVACPRILRILSIVLLSELASGANPEWQYAGANGPSHWGGLSRDFSVCEEGHQQSPVDIRKAIKAALPPIRFDYQETPLRLVNNGHTVQLNYAPGSFVSVGQARYELKQIHFHRPSEERIGGKTSDMVAHLVHVGASGSIVVVAVLLSKGAANGVVQQIWNAIPKAVNQEVGPAGISISAVALLPRRLGYYTYTGSLTTPPCTEGVTWLVLKEAMSISGEQVKSFAARFAPNARPVQPLGTRVVNQTE